MTHLTIGVGISEHHVGHGGGAPEGRQRDLLPDRVVDSRLPKDLVPIMVLSHWKPRLGVLLAARVLVRVIVLSVLRGWSSDHEKETQIHIYYMLKTSKEKAEKDIPLIVSFLSTQTQL